jgi:hypothetical protein
MMQLTFAILIAMLSSAGVTQSPSSDDFQSPPQATSRTGLIEQAQDAKAQKLTPAEPGKAEKYVTDLSEIMLSGQMHWHPFWQSAYAGGGFTLGAGYMRFISPYNFVDVRASFTPKGYKRVEAELIAPGLFGQRGTLSVLGGWREATEVGFYGFGMSSSLDNRANYGFTQPYASALLEVFPARNAFLLRGGLEVTQWKQQGGEGVEPSVDQVYTPATLPGLSTQPVYWHTQGTIGVDSRLPSRGYARRGAFYGVTIHDFTDPDARAGFNQVDYEAIQHIPILRDTWVVSLHGWAQTTYQKDGQQIPFFMMPSIGGGSDLRAYSSWRLRDLNSLVLQAEWRVMVNRYLDMALFYDAGKVAAKRTDLTLTNMKNDVGLGFRLHGQLATPLRIEFTHGSEGFGLVLSASQAF